MIRRAAVLFSAAAFLHGDKTEFRSVRTSVCLTITEISFPGQILFHEKRIDRV